MREHFFLTTLQYSYSFQTQSYTKAQDSRKNLSLRQRHIFYKQKPSCTHFTSCRLPIVKKGFVKGEALRILRKNSSETTFEKKKIHISKKTLDGRRLPKNFDRKPTIRNKIHKRESKLLKRNNKEQKEILPFVTQYQPSVTTVLRKLE